MGVREARVYPGVFIPAGRRVSATVMPLEPEESARTHWVCDALKRRGHWARWLAILAGYKPRMVWGVYHPPLPSQKTGDREVDRYWVTDGPFRSREEAESWSRSVGFIPTDWR